MQAKVSGNIIPLFRPRLTVGIVYSVSNFDVTRCAKNFSLSGSPFMIRFNGLTTLGELTNTVSSLPEEGFSFCNEADLVGLANTHSRLPDILGEVTALKSTVREPLKGKNHVMATVKLESGRSVTLSLFDSKAISLHRRIESMTAAPRVIVATNINPALVGGRLFVNATSWTDVYFDEETRVGQNRMDRCPGVPSLGPLLGEVPKLDVFTISDVNKFSLDALCQDIDFMCVGKVTRIHAEKGWCYAACTKCSRELRCISSTFTCVMCENAHAVGVLRYRVELSVADTTAEGVFVFFDGVMTQLHALEADAAAKMVVEERVSSEVSRMPPFITEMEGKIYAFHARFTTYSPSSSRQAFVVTRILGEQDQVPLTWMNETGLVYTNGGVRRPVRSVLLNYRNKPLETWGGRM